MRARILALLPLAGSAFASFYGNAPVYTVPLDQSQAQEAVEAAVNIRDAPNNVDYRCGPKIGKCPIDTCCSSAGMCQELCRLNGSLTGRT
jgi:chitin deacetylase